MKKWLTIILIAIVAICGALALTACNGCRRIPKNHAHVSDSYKIIREATCTEEGERSGVCKVCRRTFTQNIAATGHDWHLQSAEAATCTDDGSETYACANCFKLEERTVAALGHDSNVVIKAIPAGCETVGWSEGKSCSRCGEAVVAPREIPASGHSFYYEKRGNDTHATYCENCNYSEIAECEFEETEIAPTCVDSGKLLHTCKVCGDSHEHETFAALGHFMTEQKTFYKTVDGVYKHRQTCYRCEYYEEEDCGTHVESTVKATCETIGYTVYTCEECGNTYNSDFKDALGHDWTDYTLDDDNSDPYAHTHRRHCQRLGCTAEENGVPVGAVGTVISVRTDETCESDALTQYTCSLATCTYKHSITHTDTKLGHSWSDWEYSGDNDEVHNHTRHCLRSSCTEGETKNCRMTTSNQAATCTKPEIEVSVCEDCLHVDRDEFPALGHKWSAWINVRDMNGGSMHTHVCNVCGVREYGTHSYETTTTPADCDHDATTVNTCSVCSHSTNTIIPNTALGHEWEVVSCDSNEHSLICNRYEVPHEITAQHNYSISNLCSDCRYDGLTYELSVTGDYFIVKNDNGVPKATEITVASSRPNPLSSSETLPVRAIGASAFVRNTVIKKVIIPATVTAVEANAFDGCSALIAVEFYGGDAQLTRIEYSAFNNCTALTDVKLPATLKSIGNGAFMGCARLDNITVPESVTEIGYRALYNTGYYNNDKNWVGGALYAGLHLIKVNNAYFTGSITEFAVKAGTLTVSDRAFENCTGMSKVTLPVSVKTIGTDAFGGCVNLKEVEYGGSVSDWFAITFVSTLSSPMYFATHMSILGEESEELVLPENITSIPAGTFKGNTTLTKVTITAKITSIGDEAFMGCTNLTEIIFEDDHVTYMGKDAFLDTAFYNDGSKWVDGVLILGNHILATNADFNATDYVIDDNIRTVSSGAFAACDITNLTIGSGVVWFGAGAFNTAALTGVTFKSGAGTWFAKNLGGAVRSVSVTADAAANASLLKNNQGEWRKA